MERPYHTIHKNDTENLATKKRLKHLGAVIAAFEKMMGRGREVRRGRRGKRKLSAAARRKISAAQRARWAKSRQQKAA